MLQVLSILLISRLLGICYCWNKYSDILDFFREILLLFELFPNCYNSWLKEGMVVFECGTPESSPKGEKIVEFVKINGEFVYSDRPQRSDKEV